MAMQPTSTTPSVDSYADTFVRRDAARHVAFEVLERRERGEALTDEAVIESHPGLMPELIEELVTVCGIRQARLAAANNIGPLSPIEVLRNDQLDQPIEVVDSEDQYDELTPMHAIPIVPGYGIVEAIGRGGQGAVYRAIQ